MVLWRLNMLLQCVILGLSCTGGYQDCFFFGSGASTETHFGLHPSFQLGDLHKMQTPFTPPKPSSAPHTLLIILDALQPLAGRLCVCEWAGACVSVFLWLCWRPCSGCGATAATDPTRCVLSATPAPPPGPGSASNPEATSAAICRQIAQTD